MIRLKQVFVLLIISSIGLSTEGLAQEVIFCESYTNTGIPKKAAQVWVVDTLPLRVQIMYNNGKTTIDRSKVNFLIEPEERLNMETDKVHVNVSQGRNWVVVERMFTEPGKYAVSVFTPENEIMAGSMINVKLTGNMKPKAEEKEPKADKTQVSKADAKADQQTLNKVVLKQTKKNSIQAEKKPVEKEIKKKRPSAPEGPKTGFNPAEKVEITSEDKEVLHYDGVKLQFGTSLDNGKLTGASESFTKDKGRVKVMTQLMNPQPLKTEMLQADFWLKSNTGEYDELVVSEEHKANPRSYKAYFTTDLFKSGEYKVSVYTEDFVWIASSYLTVE